MVHLLQRSKRSIFHDIFKNVVFQRRQKALLWSKGLNYKKFDYESLMYTMIMTRVKDIKSLETKHNIKNLQFAQI